MYVVAAAPLRSERHNTKQGTSPLDASDVIHTNQFQIYGGTKMEDREINRNSQRKWKIKKIVRNNNKDIYGTIYYRDDKTLKYANYAAIWAKN